MILIVENWEKGAMELAMLLDECPSPAHDSANSSLEPWAEGGCLARGLDSAEASGRADLYLVFRSDARASWGSRRITAVAGGVLCCDAVPGRGLKFEVVHRPFFGNIVGEDTALPYRVVEEAFLAPDPDRAGGMLLKLNRKHPSLGYTVAQRGLLRGEDDGHGLGVDDEYGTGVRIKWVDQTGCVRRLHFSCDLVLDDDGTRLLTFERLRSFFSPWASLFISYSEDWFVADEKGGAEFEFLALEFARRQYVQVILASLGFVRGESLAPRSREAITAALLRGIAPHLQALTSLLVDDAPTRFAVVEAVRPTNAAVGSASAATLHPNPLPVPAKLSSRLSPAVVEAARPTNAAMGSASAATLHPNPLPVPAMLSSRLSPAANASCTPADKAPSSVCFEGANAAANRHRNVATAQPVPASSSGPVLVGAESFGRAKPFENVVGNGQQARVASNGEGGTAPGGRETAYAGGAVVGTGLQRPGSNGVVVGQARSMAPLSPFAVGASQAAPAPPPKRMREDSKLEIVELSD